MWIMENLYFKLVPRTKQKTKVKVYSNISETKKKKLIQ